MSCVNVNSATRRQFLLVVDSDPASLEHTSTLLKRFQYKPWTARTAQEALEITNVAMPALIVTARQLEDMPGVDFIRKLKQKDRSGKLSVIVLNRDTDAAQDRACLAAGAVTCLKTPVGVENLYRVVQVAVEPVPRMNIRINTKLPAVIKSQALTCGDGKCVRVLSENGLFVRTPDPYPMNTKVPVKIKLDGRVLSADAVVIYTHMPGNQANHEPGMGLQFTQIDQQDQERIRLFIRDEVTRGITVSRA